MMDVTETAKTVGKYSKKLNENNNNKINRNGKRMKVAVSGRRILT